MARKALLDQNKLHAIKVTGKGLTANLVEDCLAAGLSISNSQVTEMTLRFKDSMDLDTFRSGVLAEGASISYSDWALTASDNKVGPGTIGPELTVRARSKYVTKLRKQTGAKNWGNTDVSAWARDVIKSVGATPVVQPGLGKTQIVRQKPDGDNRENTWDVLTNMAKEKGVWLFEYGSRFVFAKPSWLIKNDWARQSWPLFWDDWDTYSDGLAGMPEYTNDPEADPRESLSLKLVSTDADQIRPGDEVTLSGRGAGSMKGTWIVTGVGFPMTVAGVVTVACQRPIDPVAQPPQTSTPTGKNTSSSSGSSSSGSAGGSGGAPAGLSAAVDRFVSARNRQYLDFDGFAGAQCVDLAQFYSRDVIGGGFLSGNGAKDIWNTAGSKYQRISKGSTARKGDLAIWGSSWGGGYGHIAVVLADNGGNLKTFTQNPGPSQVANLGKNGLLGYLRPTGWR